MEQVIKDLDLENAKDPNFEIVNGEKISKSILYSLRMREWLKIIEPDASEELVIAAHGQHFKRWEIPRNEYPKGKKGYHQWRNYLKVFQSEEVRKCLQKLGYQKVFIDRVSSLIQKKNMRNDHEAQTLEDVVCLVFLQYYFGDFSTTEERAKMIDIVRKTWNKMSDNAKTFALEIKMSDDCMAIVKEAVL